MKKFRVSRVAQRFVEREKKGRTLRISQQSGQHGRNPNALLYEQLEYCAEFIGMNMEVARNKAWDLYKHENKVQGTFIQAREQFLQPPNRTAQEKVVASRSNWNHEDPEFIVLSGACHMMSENELTTDEIDTIRKSKRTHRHHDRQR